MAKRRNKNKVKRRFVGLNRNVQINSEITEKMFKMDVHTELETKSECNKVNDPREKVQVTESGILTDCVTENKTNKQETMEIHQKNTRKRGKRKTSKNKPQKQQKSVCLGKHAYGTVTTDEMLICPTEIDGETCIEIICGNNEAHLYLSKLCVGSKGACIHYSDSWLTPNEFQTISGRETAKDWKRSIRHNGRSLKMLISKGLITVQNISSKKAQEDVVEELREEIDPNAKSSKKETRPEAVKDEKDTVVDGNSITVDKKIKPDTKRTGRKRGRKPKRLRHRKAPARIKTLNGKTEALNGKTDALNWKTEALINPLNGKTEALNGKTEALNGKTEALIDPLNGKTEALNGNVDTSNSSGTSSPQTVDSLNQTHVDEINTKSEVADTVDQTNVVEMNTRSEVADSVNHNHVKEMNTGSEVADSLDKTQVDEMNTESTIAESVAQTHVDEINKGSVISEEKRVDKPETTPTSPEDTQTQEDRRLDEFVKLLRLTKAVAPKSAPDISSFAKVKDVRENTEDDELEMPVLQKEADIIPNIHGSHGNDRTDVHVDTFHVTVTPPPTPPADGIVIDRKTDDEKLIETFKSRLASPSNGLKLTINREKVKVVDADNKDRVNTFSKDVNTGQNCTRTNMQSLLLQDALQSAKRYKEQLKQNSHIPASRLSSQVLQMNMKPGDCKPVDNSLASSVIQRTSDVQHGQVQKRGNNNIHRDQDSRRHMYQPKTHHPYYSMPSMENMDNLAGMSFQEFLDVMFSIYGPLPFPVDTKDAAFAALQEMNRRHDMLRLITQSQANGSSSSFMYPVMTQQILLAMTQQLYNLCNIPGWLPSTKPAEVSSKLQTSEIQHKQIPSTFDIRNHKVPQTKDTQHHKGMFLQELQHRRTPHSQEHQNRWISPSQQDISLKKRKQSEAVTDCALDLSVKRQKVEYTSTSKPANVNDVNCYDAPLDFSMKKTKCRDQCYHKDIGHVTSALNGSVKVQTQMNFDRRMSNYTNAVQNSSSKICTCDRVREEDITSWSVEHVCYFLRDLDGCAPYAKTFHEQGISGRLLPYLTTQHLTRTLGMKVGPALTLIQAVERKFKERNMMPSPSPCHHCQKV